MTSSMENATNLIKVIALYPESLNTLVDTFVKQASIFQKKDYSNIAKENLKENFMSSEFLKPFAERFNELFSPTEIIELLKIYQSDVMQKMAVYSKKIMNPLYEAMREKIEKIG